MYDPINVMFLMAGEGTRLRPITSLWAKPAVPLLNIPIGYYTFGLLQTIKINRLVYNTHYLPDQVKKIMNQSRLKYHHIIESHETDLMGSGGGIALVRNELLPECLVINGDEVLFPKERFELSDFIKFHRDNQNDVTILTQPNKNVGQTIPGVWFDSNLNIKGFGVTPPEDSLKGEHFVGIALYGSRLLSQLIPGEKPNILYDSITSLIRNQGKAKVYSLDCHWFETGTIKDYYHTTFLLKELLDQNDSYFLDLIKKTAEINPSFTYENIVQGFNNGSAVENSFIGNNSSIKGDYPIKNSIIFPNNQVSQTLDSVIYVDEDTIVSPF